MVIALHREAEDVGQRRIEPQAAQPIAAQAAGIIIGIIDAGDRRRIDFTGGVGQARHKAADIAAIGPDLRDLQCQRPVAGNIIPIIAKAVDLFERQILIIIFLPVGEIDKTGQLAAAREIINRLGIDLVRALGADAFPLLGIEIAIGKRAAKAAKRAGIQPDIAADRVIRAIGEIAGDPEILAGITRLELDGAAKIGRAGGAERAGALADTNTANVVGDDGAADMQAVGVAIAHVAQRHAIKGEAKLVLVEAAQRNPCRPFVDAERIGRLEIDAGQLLNRLERAGASDGLAQIDLRHLGDLADLAAAENDDFRVFIEGDLGDGGRGGLRMRGIRKTQDSASEQQGANSFACHVLSPF